ncbi:MAG: VCBS repeat-containing protein, partial [Bacteroidota bacterium]
MVACNQNDKKQFELIPSSESGIDFVNKVVDNGDASILDYPYFYNGGGVSVGDINNDGLVDLYFTSNQGSNKLYLNKGNMKFEDITETARVAGHSDWNTGSVMADVNGDGFLDIYVMAVVGVCGFEGRNELFINQGDGTFKEEAGKYSLDFATYSGSAAFFDYDKDGDLDMYLLNQAAHTNLLFGSNAPTYPRNYESGDRLLENKEEHFVDVSEKAGIHDGPAGCGLGLGIADFNNDGWDDIYVGNDSREDDYYYINNGDGTFSEQLKEYLSMVSRSSRGNDIADINADGFVDIITVDALPEDEKILKASRSDDPYELQIIYAELGYHPQYMRNMLQINNGGKFFSERAFIMGVAATDWSWSPLFADLDQDGIIDLFITTGIHRRPNDLDYSKFISSKQIRDKLNKTRLVDDEALNKMPMGNVHNYIFQGDGKYFTNKSGQWIPIDTLISNGSAYADLDNDGDLDLVINNYGTSPVIYRNINSKDYNYLKLRFLYRNENRFGIGTKVLLYNQNKFQTRQLNCTRGFQSSVDPSLHFGLGSSKFIDSLIIIWPDNSYQKLEKINVNQTLNISPSENLKQFDWTRLQPVHDKWFDKPDISKIISAAHEENSFDDFKRQKFIPYKISTEGPALAVGDVNGDGLQDVYLGGAKSFPGRLFIQSKEGFSLMETPDFIADRNMEDVDAQLNDLDVDGDLDLFVVSAGGEFYKQSPELKDRIYFNDGKGHFTKREQAVPDFFENGSVARMADYDNDGDIDIFVAGRAVPNCFGEIPNSYLLENDGHGNFSISSQPALKNAGMVTDAVWTDFNGDQIIDLILVGDWMSPQFYISESGTFTNVTEKYLPESIKGLWRTIQPADLNKDGKMDYLVGNWGLNSKFHASQKYPLKMYVDDFDRNGQKETLIALGKKRKYYPVNSKDEIDSLMGNITRRKFPDYRDFAGNTMEQVFGNQALAKASLLEVTTLASGFLRNNGNTFSFVPLNDEFQISPVNRFLVDDLNADGKEDILIAPNFLGVTPYHGRFVSNTETILSGDGRILDGLETGINFSQREIRRIATITVNYEKYLLAAPNNDSLLWYKIKK